MFVHGDFEDQGLLGQMRPSLRFKLAKQHKVVYISGLGDAVSVAKRHALKLSSYIYDHSSARPSRVELILNTSSLTRIDYEEVKKVRGYIAECGPKIEDAGDNEILLVFFAHSLGAKVLCDALQSTETRIRNTIAIITFGGVIMIQRNMAAVVQNFRFPSDCKSQCAFWCCFSREYGQYTREPEKYDVLSPAPYFERNDSCLCPGLLCDCRHSMEEYLREDDMLDNILSILGRSICQPVVSVQP